MNIPVGLPEDVEKLRTVQFVNYKSGVKQVVIDNDTRFCMDAGNCKVAHDVLSNDVYAWTFMPSTMGWVTMTMSKEASFELANFGMLSPQNLGLGHTDQSLFAIISSFD